MDHPQCSEARLPDDFDTVVHKINILLTLWTQMERERVPLHEMANLIEYLSYEPLARATTAPAMYKEFDALTDNLQTLFGLHRELQHKGLSVQGIHQSIRVWVGGPLTSAAIGPESNPNLVQSVGTAPNEAATAIALTEAVQSSSPSAPATNPSKLVDQASNKSATADDLTEAVQPSTPTPATDPSKFPNESSKKSATADDSTEAIQPSTPTPVLNEAACHAETYGEPHLRASNWKLEDPVTWKLSGPLETHFNELCPINLLGNKCKCPLPKVNLKDPSLYKEKPWLQPTCKAWLEDQCARKPCDKAHNHLVERRHMASESRLQDHALLLERIASERNKQKA